MPVRKRGNTWSWYFDMAKVNESVSEKKKVDIRPKLKQRKH